MLPNMPVIGEQISLGKCVQGHTIPAHIRVTTVPVLYSLLEKRVSFCSFFKALSTDTSFIKLEFAIEPRI